MPCDEDCRTAVLGKTERTVGWKGYPLDPLHQGAPPDRNGHRPLGDHWIGKGDLHPALARELAQHPAERNILGPGIDQAPVIPDRRLTSLPGTL